MPTPQPGIFALGTRTHHQLELDVEGEVDDEVLRAAVRALLDPGVTGGGSNVVLGFGSSLWPRLAPAGDVPTDAGPFREIVGIDGHRAPSTQHDLWIWVHGTGADAVLDAARTATAALDGVAALAVDCPCFVYHDSRDLTGFIDGTANPPLYEASDVACIPDGRPGAGGSHVITQRWIHDLAAFGALSVADQERVIGRTKPDSESLGDLLPPDAHVARAEVHDAQGEERPIWRRSVPTGTVGELGLYFLGFSAERDRFDAMLARMYGTASDGVRDHLLDFSRPVTGSYYFAPSVEALAAIG